MDKKLEYVAFVVMASTKLPSGGTKQGSIKFDASYILDLISANPDIEKTLSDKFDFSLSHVEIKKVLEENSVDESGSLNDFHEKFFYFDGSKFKLNKTPTSTIRNIVVTVLGEKGTFTSVESKELVKTKLFDSEMARPADKFTTKSQMKEPVDQIITNVISSNLENKVNALVIQRRLIEGKKDEYIYSLTEDGKKLYLELSVAKEINEDTTPVMVEKTQNEISDRFHRSADLRRKLEGWVEEGAVHVCEANLDHGTFVKPTGETYFEGHHVLPNSISSKEKDLNTEKIGNFVALCPLCHTALHRGNYETFGIIMKNILSIPRVKKQMDKYFPNTTETEKVEKLFEFYSKIR